MIRKYPFTLVLVAVIWVLCLMPIPENPLSHVSMIDKWTHLVMYGGTSAVLWWEYVRHHERLCAWKLWLFAVVGMIMMGGVIELVQAYCTTNRSGEWLDFLADSLGVGLGALIGLLFWRFRR